MECPKIRFPKQRLNVLLKGLLGSQNLVDKWWDSPNKAFHDMTPTEAYEEVPCVLINYILNQFHH